MKSSVKLVAGILFFSLILAMSSGQQYTGRKSETKGGDLLTSIHHPFESINSENSIEASVVQLFKKYHWTIAEKLNAYTVRLPSNLLHDAGEFPVKIYWAYNLELSRSIGLDFSEFLGQEILVEIYKLNERLPDFMRPYYEAHSVILKNRDTIVGAFIHKSRVGLSFGCSLDRRSVPDLTGKKWAIWIEDIINYENELEIRLSLMEPEDVILEYFGAIERHDVTTQMACLTRKWLCLWYLAANADDRKLYKKGYQDYGLFHADVMISAIISSIKKAEHINKSNPPGHITFKVSGDFRFDKNTASTDGYQGVSVTLEKETQRCGWRIREIGTG